MVDDAIKALELGPGVNVQAAYQNLAVHPDDCYLPGMKWRDALLRQPHPSFWLALRTVHI